MGSRCDFLFVSEFWKGTETRWSQVWGLGPPEGNIAQAFPSDSHPVQFPLGSRDRDRLSVSSSLLCFVPKELACVGCFNERLACWLPEGFSHRKHKEKKGGGEHGD